SALPKWLTSSRKVTGPTFSLRIRRSEASRSAALSSAPAGRAAPGGPRLSRACPNLALPAFAQAADVFVVLEADQPGRDEDYAGRRPAAPPGDKIEQHDDCRCAKRGERRVARGRSYASPHQAEQ